MMNSICCYSRFIRRKHPFTIHHSSFIVNTSKQQHNKKLFILKDLRQFTTLNDNNNKKENTTTTINNKNQLKKRLERRKSGPLQENLLFKLIDSQQEERKKNAEDAALASSNLSWNAVQRALIGNAVITLMKFGVYAQTGSSVMFAEAIHSLADSGYQIFLLKGLSDSSKKPDRYSNFGYGQASFFWSLVSALVMFHTGKFDLFIFLKKKHTYTNLFIK